ncbi:MAG: hypothetical protein LC792_22940 [Actinobacteria bacterium]|nr:hypothetical protein [Actinomycetota bacterium]
MQAEQPATAQPDLVDRCACGRIATARCWLGENTAARWLFSCIRRCSWAPDTPEAA